MSKIHNPDTGRMVSVSGVIGKKLLKLNLNSETSNDDDFPLVRSSGDYKNKVKIIPISEIKSKLLEAIDVNDDISDTKLVDEMVDAFGMETNDYFTHYEIFVFATELDKKSEAYNCKISKKGINHAAIRLLSTNGNYYTIEWGMLKSVWEIEFDSVVQSDSYWYDHQGQENGKIKQDIWKGCRAIYGKINKKITADRVATHAIQWSIKLGSKGGNGKTSYPYNCRGYVDSFLVSVLKMGVIDWVGEGMF